MAFNKVILHGRLTKDVELKTTQSGTSYCKFTVAVDRPYAKDGEDRKTDFIDCTAWRKTAEIIAKYFSKGQGIIVDGQLHNNNYEDGNGVKHYSCIVQVDSIDFAERKDAQDGTVSAPPKEPNFEEIAEGEDLPF